MRLSRRSFLESGCAAAALVTLTALVWTESGEPFVASDFVRFRETGPAEGRLETASVTYRGPRGEEVTLVAAVHVADETYYRRLQEDFARYEAVLYELIAREEDAPRATQSRSGVSFFQRALKAALGLEFQLDALDYGRPNFIHADLDPETFARLQAERGESILGLLLKASLTEWRRQMAEEGSSFGLGHILVALASEDTARMLKFFLARELENMERILAGFGEGTGKEKGGRGTVLVTERNKKALAVLRREIRRGKKRLAIFYGAAHMPDLEERLVRGLGFEKKEERWLAAWDVTRRKAAGGGTGVRDAGQAEPAREEGPPAGGGAPKEPRKPRVRDCARGGADSRPRA